MTGLPNPFDSGTQACSPDEAAAVPSPRSPAAAAETPSATERRNEEAPASTSTVTVAAGDAGATIQELLDAIGGDCRFVLDEEAFMAAIEPPPLFLQRTA